MPRSEARLQSARAHDEIARSQVVLSRKHRHLGRNKRMLEQMNIIGYPRLIHRNDLNRAALAGEAKSRTTAVLIHDEKQQNATALSHRCGDYQQKRNAFSGLGAEGERAGRRIGAFL